MSPTAALLPSSGLPPSGLPSSGLTTSRLPIASGGGRGPETPGGAPDPGPAAPTRRRLPRLPLAGKLGVLLALLVGLLVIATGAVLGPLRQAQRDQDAILSGEVQQALQARRMQLEFERQGQEWRAILLQGSDPTALSVHVRGYRDRSAAVTALATQLHDERVDPASVDALVAFETEYQAMDEAYDDVLTPFVAGGGRNPAVPEAATADRDRGPSARLDALVDRLDAATATARAAQQAALAHQRTVLLLLGLLIVAVVAAVVAMVVLGIVRPIRRLADEVDRTARETLPAAVARVMALPADAARPVLAPLHTATGDELEELGRAVSAIRDAAIDVAVRRRRGDQEAAQTLVNLGRRNQYLVEHTQACLAKLKAGRPDPATAAHLVQLDCTTSRIRRSAASMLVLGGATVQTRIGSRPVPVAEIVRAALAEVEDGGRVDLHHVEEAAVIGAAVPDLTHLVAELLENATNFSPPDVRVTVVGRFGSSGRYGLHVVDGGIGMASHELAAANARIAQAAWSSNLDTHRLGLHVVGRLAARIAVEVTLRPSTGRGTTAQVDLPSEIILDIERTAARYDGWTPPRGAARAAAVPPVTPVTLDTPAADEPRPTAAEPVALADE